MNSEFDLYDVQQNILRSCPEWEDLIKIVEFKESSNANPAGYRDRTIYLNSRRMSNLSEKEQAFMIAQQCLYASRSNPEAAKALVEKLGPEFASWFSYVLERKKV